MGHKPIDTIDVVEYRPEDAGEWKQFLRASNNGTLFHDLDFLAYHSLGRFVTRNLIFRQAGKIVALLPAAVTRENDGRRFLQSPWGASVGGFVLPLGQPAETTLALVERLIKYVSSVGLDGIELRLGPSIYMREPNEHLSFGLMANEFHLAQRWLCHAIPLPKNPEAVLKQCRARKVRYMRAALRKGLKPREAGADNLGVFYRMLLQDRARHRALPTHRHDEIEDLMRRLPDRIRLFLSEKDGRAHAGLLLFVLNPLVAYTFYVCQDDSYGDLRANAVLLVHVAQRAAAEGFLFLDLGPSTFDDLSLNRGLAFFKEEFGARGFCRDTWRWERG